MATTLKDIETYVTPSGCPFCGYTLDRDAACKLIVCDRCGACQRRVYGELPEGWNPPGTYFNSHEESGLQWR